MNFEVAAVHAHSSAAPECLLGYAQRSHRGHSYNTRNVVPKLTTVTPYPGDNNTRMMEIPTQTLSIWDGTCFFELPWSALRTTPLGIKAEGKMRRGRREFRAQICIPPVETRPSVHRSRRATFAPPRHPAALAPARSPTMLARRGAPAPSAGDRNRCAVNGTRPPCRLHRPG